MQLLPVVLDSFMISEKLLTAKLKVVTLRLVRNWLVSTRNTVVVNTIASYHGDVETRKRHCSDCCLADALSAPLVLVLMWVLLKATSNVSMIWKKSQMALKELQNNFALQAGREIQYHG